MFDKYSINRLFSEPKDLLTVSPDSKWVIYKFNRGSQYEIRVEMDYETKHRFYLAINETSEERLKDHLKRIGLMEDSEILW